MNQPVVRDLDALSQEIARALGTWGKSTARRNGLGRCRLLVVQDDETV